MGFFVKLFLLQSLICFKLSATILCDGDNDSNMERELVKKLFCDYDKHIRPSTSGSTDIRVRLNIKDLDYNDNYNTMTIGSWMTSSWNDSRLEWNSADYSDIKSFHIKSENVWTPDLKLYNAHIPSSIGTCHNVDCIIMSNSVVTCVMPCTFTAICKQLGVNNWPYDVQNCSFTFGSWMKSGEELNYNENKIAVATKRTKKNNQWNLLTATSRYNRGNYSFSNETYPSLTYAIVIERHNGFHQITTISMAMILILSNLLALFISPEKMTRFFLCAVNISLNSLCLEVVYWLIPYPGENSPKVLTFFGDLQIYSVLLLIMTIIMKMLLISEEKPQEWIKSLIIIVKSNSIIAILLNEHSKKLPEDADSLIENVKHQSSKYEIYSTFCRLIDRILFLITLITLSVMFVSLFPNGYLSSNYDPIESLDM